jgi:CRP/FNR family transcriptional regulator, cyclic AMP receptor protein
MAIKIEQLQLIHYFSDLTPHDLNSIKEYFSPMLVSKGKMFTIENEWSDRLYFLVSGIVKIFKTSFQGKEQIMDIAYPGEALNDISTFDGGPNYASGLAITPLQIYTINKNHIKAILRLHPDIAFKALYGVANRARQAWSLVEDLSFNQVTGRLAKMLIKYEENKAIFPHLTQTDMAAMIGTARVVVNRSIKDLEEQGAISLERHAITIVNRDILLRISQNC